MCRGQRAELQSIPFLQFNSIPIPIPIKAISLQITAIPIQFHSARTGLSQFNSNSNSGIVIEISNKIQFRTGIDPSYGRGGGRLPTGVVCESVGGV